MLQVARLAPKQLGESSALVEQFLRSRLNDDGGFADRSGTSDLYYTVFGLDGLIALRAGVPYDRIEPFLRRFGDGDGLDFVHLSCLARAWAAMPTDARRTVPADRILARLETHRTPDGGYRIPTPRSPSPLVAPSSPSPLVGEGRGGGATTPEHASLYASFLALGAYQDLQRDMPQPHRLLNCLDNLRTADAGYANQPAQPTGITTATAAAATLLRQLGRPPDPTLADWLLARCHPEGGFLAAPAAPIPDLLSTATALHALAGMHVDLDPLREPCLDFLDLLWTSRGGFYGSVADDTLDCEYTYYGLLALGHLSV